MSLSEAQLLADVRQRLFSPSKSAAPMAVGVELELIPLIEFTRKPALASKTAGVLSELARARAWKEKRISNDPPSWELGDGARISFEPGGQLEISSRPHATATSLIARTRELVTTLRSAMQQAGIELVASGVDPFNDIGVVPLQLHRERYTGMTHYFDSIGPSGVRMMRQTAALQINVERGESPLDRWLLLNAISPVVTALFSNSTHYAGKKTNHASFRAHLWRTLDDSRTGIPYDERDPVARYVDFALDAYAMRSGNSRHPYSTFREWMQDGRIGMEEWDFHLSTLFPEVRPKDYFELRSADTIEVESLAAPVLFVTSIVYDRESAQRTFEIVGTPSVDLLELAGIKGLAHPALRRMARALADIALDGARSLGAGYLSPEDVSTAVEYFDRVIPAS
ncbi:MAG TPA: glutamate-cysteine ligase family protein [Gemmatimonadaceae bacterium]|nr:glutamate-cysteine ligase family protein [Gemmatimonadaceae bacterium]